MKNKGKNIKKGVVKTHGKRVLEYKGAMEEYAKVSKALGDKRVMVVTVDGQQVIAHIPGKFKKKVWVDINSVVLVSRREFQNDKMDIIYLYENDEVKKLVKAGEIPESFLQSGVSQIAIENKENEEGFDIDYDSEDQPKNTNMIKVDNNKLVETNVECSFDFEEI